MSRAERAAQSAALPLPTTTTSYFCTLLDLVCRFSNRSWRIVKGPSRSGHAAFENAQPAIFACGVRGLEQGSELTQGAELLQRIDAAAHGCCSAGSQYACRTVLEFRPHVKIDSATAIGS